MKYNNQKEKYANLYIKKNNFTSPPAVEISLFVFLKPKHIILKKQDKQKNKKFDQV